MAFRPYEYGRLKTPRSKPITSEEWEEHHSLIEKLYVKQNWTQERLLQFFKNMNFHPSQKQLTTQLAEWGIFKNQSKRNNSTASSDRTNTRVPGDQQDREPRIENNIERTGMIAEVLDNIPHSSNSDSAPLSPVDEDRNTNQNSSTIRAPHRETSQRDERSQVTTRSQDQVPFTQHHPSDPQQSSQTETTNRWNAPWNPHIEAQPARVNELLPDLMFYLTATNPDSDEMLGESDTIDSYQSQLALAMSRDWTHEQDQPTPWNGF